MNPDSFLRYNREQVYAIVDSETCHLNLAWKENKPWQWAWILATKDRIISKTNLYVNWPHLEVSKYAAQLTRFDRNKVKRIGVTPEEACDKLDAIIYDPNIKIVGHNFLGFDIYMQNIHRLNVGRKTDYSYLERVYDTSFLLKGYKMGMQPRRGESLLVYQLRLANTPVKGVKTKVEIVCKEFDIPYSLDAHDAEEDVEMQYQIWQKVLHQVEV